MGAIAAEYERKSASSADVKARRTNKMRFHGESAKPPFIGAKLQFLADFVSSWKTCEQNASADGLRFGPLQNGLHATPTNLSFAFAEVSAFQAGVHLQPLVRNSPEYTGRSYSD